MGVPKKCPAAEFFCVIFLIPSLIKFHYQILNIVYIVVVYDELCICGLNDGRLFERLLFKILLGIFPEGGSHDRLELLPLKPGVAIMALRAAMEGAEDILVVPLGLNYYQAHKILSRATIQVGTPLVVRDETVQLYQKDRRAAVAQLLSEIEEVRVI